MKQYRLQAREALRGKWKAALPLILVYQLVVGAFGMRTLYQQSHARLFSWGIGDFSLVDLYLPRGAGWALFALLAALWLLQGMMMAGLYRATGAVLDGEAPRLRQLFPWNLLGKGLLVAVVASGISMLGGLLFPIISLILNLNYGMAFYILARSPQLGAAQALRESRLRMRGNKWRRIKLIFSFFGWILLVALAYMVFNRIAPNAGEVVNWLVLCLLGCPLWTYIYTADAAFYRDVDARYNK